MNVLAEIRNLAKEFGRGRRRRRALEEVTLAVEPGEVVALLGRNGAGKTTTIACLLGFLRPSGGTVRLLGREPSDPRAREKVGFLGEEFPCYPRYTGRQTIHLLARLRGLNDTGHTWCEALLRGVGLHGDGDRKVGTYSKGMRQRLGMAQALAAAPTLLVLDEPFSGLDPPARAQALAMIRDRVRDGMGVLFSTHLLGDVEEVGARPCVLAGGRIVESGTLADLAQRSPDGRWRSRALEVMGGE